MHQNYTRMHNFNLRNSALILEGGGMRGTFTAGVLDTFLRRDIHFPYLIGVSAGSTNALSYLSKQIGRTRSINIDMLNKYHYIGFKHYVRKKNWIDYDLLFHSFPFNEVPFDFDAFFSNETTYEFVATDCLTGKAHYLTEKENPDRLLTICKASCSLPFISPVVDVDGTPMLDGGISDSIPIERAISKGYKNSVLVLTQEKGYRKKISSIQIPKFALRKYPKICEGLNFRAYKYNETMDLVENLEKKGEITVIRPTDIFGVTRTEQDTIKLMKLYLHGMDIAQEFLNNHQVK